jgi:hypothetical protein
LFIRTQTDDGLHFVVLHFRVEPGHQSAFFSPFIRLDNALGSDGALNGPPVTVEVTVDAGHRVSLVRVEHRDILILLPPFWRAYGGFFAERQPLRSCLNGRRHAYARGRKQQRRHLEA